MKAFVELGKRNDVFLSVTYVKHHLCGGRLIKVLW